VPSASGGTSGSATPGPAQTPDERRAALDRRLNESLGTFDETLKKEQETVARERDARDAEASAAASQEGEDSSGEEGSGSADAGVPATDGQDPADKRSRSGDLRSDRQGQKDGTGGKAAPGSGASGSAIPDGSDDDIVARRLRRAAEQETDPELKEKLWKEYIEYKKNAGKS